MMVYPLVPSDDGSVTQKCTICSQTKPLDSFPKEGKGSQRWAKKCKQCRAATKKAWNQANPEKYKAAKRRGGLKSLYGLTTDQYDSWVEAQGNQCAICGATEPGGRGEWHIDHDHACCSDKKSCGECLRGLLCLACNMRLGVLEQTEWCGKAQAYLATSSGVPGDVMATARWPTNAHLIEDVAKLGYIRGPVLDCTVGLGNFWTRFSPNVIGTDIDPEKSEDGLSHDFRDMSEYEDNTWGTVVMDAPYRLNGTPDRDYDYAYGIDQAVRWQDRMKLILDGIPECIRVLQPGGCFLLKCQDQVVSGKKVWQTRVFAEAAQACNTVQIDRFDMLTVPRPQPDGRKQVHSRSNTSQLLVFRKGRPR